MHTLSDFDGHYHILDVYGGAIAKTKSKKAATKIVAALNEQSDSEAERLAEVGRAAQHLLDKLVRMEGPLNESLATNYVRTGVQYSGPNWGKEFDALKHVLATAGLGTNRHNDHIPDVAGT